jgi:hypothetical protein
MGSHRDCSRKQRCVFPGKLVAEEMGCDFKKSSQNKTGQVMSPFGSFGGKLLPCGRAMSPLSNSTSYGKITKHHRNPKNAANA